MIELVLNLAVERHWIRAWSHVDGIWLVDVDDDRANRRYEGDGEIKAFCEGLLSAGMVKVEDQ